MLKKLIGKKYNIDEENIFFCIGRNVLFIYDIFGKFCNCRIGVNNYGVGKFYISFVYKFKFGKYILRSILNGKKYKSYIKRERVR